MAKDPAFLFYTGDFSTGTQFFSDEQLGKFLRLLMAQHQHGHLSERHVLQICKSYDNDVMAKFKKDESGFFYNQRLEDEVGKRKMYSESRSKNRKICKTYDSHMEDKNKDTVLVLNTKESITIGPTQFKGKTSDWLRLNKEAAIEQLMMQRFSSLSLEQIFKTVDDETVQYHFKDTNHPYNYFKSTAERLSKEKAGGGYNNNRPDPNTNASFVRLT